MESGDYLFYSESGSFFIDSIDRLIRIAAEMKHYIVIPICKCKVIQGTRRDTLILMNMDDPIYLNQYITLSTYILLKKSPRSMEFVKEWLELSQDRRIITDDENVMGKPDYRKFIEHRTQAILALLYIKHGLMNKNYRSLDFYLPEYKSLPPHSDQTTC